MIARLQLPSLAYKSLMLIYFCPLKQCGNTWGLYHWGVFFLDRMRSLWL